jgi:hypothetical protein
MYIPEPQVNMHYMNADMLCMESAKIILPENLSTALEL